MSGSSGDPERKLVRDFSFASNNYESIGGFFDIVSPYQQQLQMQVRQMEQDFLKENSEYLFES